MRCFCRWPVMNSCFGTVSAESRYCFWYSGAIGYRPARFFAFCAEGMWYYFCDRPALIKFLGYCCGSCQQACTNSAFVLLFNLTVVLVVIGQSSKRRVVSADELRILVLKWINVLSIENSVVHTCCCSIFHCVEIELNWPINWECREETLR